MNTEYKMATYIPFTVRKSMMQILQTICYFLLFVTALTPQVYNDSIRV